MNHINSQMPKGRGMVKWQPFASMPEQYEGIARILEEQTKVPRPVLTQDTKDQIERNLLRSLKFDEEILITYYRNGYLFREKMTVIDINTTLQCVTFTDAFRLRSMFNFIDITNAE